MMLLTTQKTRQYDDDDDDVLSTLESCRFPKRRDEHIYVHHKMRAAFIDKTLQMTNGAQMNLRLPSQNEQGFIIGTVCFVVCFFVTPFVLQCHSSASVP